MKRITTTLVLLAAIMSTTATAGAADWMFKRSNYSYSPYRGQAHGANRFARTDNAARPRGYIVRSGYRYIHSSIIVGGRSSDHVNLTESWVQFAEQF